jgi:hypothetical protein
MLNQLHKEDTISQSVEPRHTLVTFGISASNKLIPGYNLTGWKITWLAKTYGKIAGAAGLVRRGDFRVCGFSKLVMDRQADDTLCVAE